MTVPINNLQKGNDRGFCFISFFLFLFFCFALLLRSKILQFLECVCKLKIDKMNQVKDKKTPLICTLSIIK